MRRVWLELAREDIEDAYRRTTLGPAWLLVNYALYLAAFMVIFGASNAQVIGHLALGLLIWLPINDIIGMGSDLFQRERYLILGTRLPFFVYVLRLTCEVVLRAAYPLIGCVVVLLLVGVPLSFDWIYAGVGLAIIVVAMPAAALVLAILGLLLPDMQFIVNNLMRVGIFVTPIFWSPSHSGQWRDTLYALNPFTYFIEVARAPVLNGGFALIPFVVSGGLTLCLWLAALMLLGRFRHSIVFMF